MLKRKGRYDSYTDISSDWVVENAKRVRISRLEEVTIKGVGKINILKKNMYR